MSEREAIETKITEARRARGKALLDGVKIDSASIAALQEHLAALDDADGERTRRERDTAEQARQAKLASLRKHLAGLEAERLAAIEEAEHHARALAENLARVFAVTKQMGAVAHEITGDDVPIVLQGTSVVTRMAGRLASVMQTIPNHRGRLGGLEWRGAGLYPADQNWRDHEQRVVAPHVKPITEGKSNGSSGQG
jgi:hypothetical protein